MAIIHNIFCCSICTVMAYSQQEKISGYVKDLRTNKPITAFEVEIPNTINHYFFTNVNGVFSFPVKKQIEQFVITAKAYHKQWITVKDLKDKVVFLKPLDKTEEDFSLISLTDDQLEDETGEVSNVSGIFSASDDVYLNTVGFEFQGVFYSTRGLDSAQKTFLLNGVQQNRLYDHRPAWSNWGGVDGIYRSQDQTEPLGISEKTFGGPLGVTSLTTRASKYRHGTRVSYAHSNRSYQHKTSVSHVGSLPHDWSYLISGSKRWGDQGYREGTVYEASSMLLSLEKYINLTNSISVSFMRTPSRRGTAGAYTDEVFRLKGNQYNGNWGYQNGNKRNARIREINEPLLLLTHTFEAGDKIRWENSILLQKGRIGYSRLDYNGGSNPDAAYYQNLPSYWLSRNRIDYENVYEYEQEFLNDGQLDWTALYQANTEVNSGNQNSKGYTNDAFVLYEDRRDEDRIQINSNLSRKINDDWQFNTSLEYRNTSSNNYAKVLDLLGGFGYLDVASFTGAQSDLNHPNRIVKEGDKFKYNYCVKSTNVMGFTQTTWRTKEIEMSGALGFSYSCHQREGMFDYENHMDAIGKSEQVSLLAYQLKSQVLYKLSGRNLVHLKAAYIQKSPGIKQVFPNARVSNTTLQNLDPENLSSYALSYIYRGLGYSVKLSGYKSLQSNVIETGFYFAEGFGTDADDDPSTGDLLDENSLFVQQVLNNVKKEYQGIELGSSYDLSSTIKLTGVIGLGKYVYKNHPNLLLYVEEDATALDLGFKNGVKDLGEVRIKNKHLSTGPQQAISLKLAYHDPSYWRISASINQFRSNYIAIAPIRYSSNFTNEINGVQISNLDPDLVATFRKQEQLENFTLINLSGGKSWRLQKGYVSVYWNVQNLLGVNYRTGGFSSSRAANYSEQLKDHKREIPLFGNRYFVGNGRTFFTGIYYSF
ncbi:TonB-dependent receptor [Wenyingzhuangia sp.]|uniref:TonB-dependent receptor n=1 Tax=Wenyingzhuangia sp. TaxID=1964193 RepID=UPI003219277A